MIIGEWTGDCWRFRDSAAVVAAGGLKSGVGEPEKANPLKTGTPAVSNGEGNLGGVGEFYPELSAFLMGEGV